MKKKLILAAMAAATCLTGTAAQAADSMVYTLAPVTVTAQRYEKKDVNVAASTQIMSSEELVSTGQQNLQQALSFLDSTTYNGMGPNGTPISSMTSKIIMRGVQDGTLVMVNGTPINWRGKYNLEDIPVDSIEKVEVVRGGGAVLYGSQATGGVINIITKKKMPNRVSAGLGNYHYNKWGDTGLISSNWPGSKYHSGNIEMRQRFKGSEKNDFLATYKISDNLDFLYNHDESSNRWEYTFQRGAKPAIRGKTRYTRRYERDKDFVQLNLHDLNGWSGHLFYNKNTLETHGTDYYTSSGTKNKKPKSTWNKERNLTYGYDGQKVWKGNLQTFLLGTSYEREEYYDYADADHSRNIFSVFGSWDRALTDKDQLTLSGRETWTTGAANNKNFHNFSGQAQYLHKLDENQSVYASVGQSFVLPSFSQMYSDANRPGVRIVGDSSLQPEKGMHYELGWKNETDKVQYKVALFATRIKDNITYSKVSKKGQEDKWYALNEDFKNHGIETSVTVKSNDNFSWHAGLTVQDPKSKTKSQKAGSKTYWDRSYGRFQLNGGINYVKDKWSAALNATYLADRVLTPTSKHSFDEKPYLLTALSVKYSPNSISDITLTVNNILDRDDNLNHTSSHYSTTPINWMLSYNYRF